MIYKIIAVIGIIFAIICLVINLWLRNQKYVNRLTTLLNHNYCLCLFVSYCRLVKLGSPYVNVLIIAGAVVYYVMVILLGVDENVASYSTVDGLCHARVWLAMIGFSLLYGTIFAKTWRIYYIFSHTKPNSKFVSSYS